MTSDVQGTWVPGTAESICCPTGPKALQDPLHTLSGPVWPKGFVVQWKEMQGPSYRLGESMAQLSAEPQPVGPPVFCDPGLPADVERISPSDSISRIRC